MHIAILGAGRVGSTLGRGLAAAGHHIHYALRDPSAPPDERLQHERATTGSTAEVVARAEVAILATPWAAAESVVSSLDFGGKVLIDATNPIGPGFRLTHGHDDSGAEQVQRWAPSARVVKCFNTTGMENMAEPAYATGASMMLACGDDADAVDTAVQLAGALGFDAHAFGGLSEARYLEPFAMVWIKLAMVHGQGRGFLRR
jgi:predicted dinucleotide-binding enzyme